MNNRNLKLILSSGLCCAMLLSQGCSKTDDMQNDVNAIRQRFEQVKKIAKNAEDEANAFRKLTKENLYIVGITPIDKGFKVELSDNTSYDLVSAADMSLITPEIILKNATNGITPKLRITADGYWQYSEDGGKTFKDMLVDGKKVPAVGETKVSNQEPGLFSSVKLVEKDGVKQLQLTTKEGKYTFPVIETFFIEVKGTTDLNFLPGASRTFEVKQSDVAHAIVKAPQGWKVVLSETSLTITPPASIKASDEKYPVSLIATSKEGYMRTFTLDCTVKKNTISANATPALKEFANKDPKNVLVDFSYAGYSHGEIAPPDVSSLGYTVYDVTKYGAIPNDGKSDKEAVLAALAAIKGVTKTPEGPAGKKATRFQGGKVNAILYFPKGTYILQDKGENNNTIRLTMSNIIIKGDGKDNTTLVMKVANEAANPSQMWSSPTMIEIKHNSDITDFPLPINVTAEAEVGSHTIQVNSTAGVKTDDWVCLYLKNNSPKLISQELGNRSITSSMSDLKNNGVQVLDYHQVKSVHGNTIEFYEPLLKKVESKWNWSVKKYPHQENVGVEDLTFEGNAVRDFTHHRSALDDGGYKPLDFVRVTNSWIRRVGYKSVSEATSIVNSANVSVYDIEISGNRGHSAIRSQASSRVFIGKVNDHSDGYTVKGDKVLGTEVVKGAGQYHACGVSKQSMGAVIWRVKWGSDACYESHATQPRCTLIDCCEGAFMPWRQGGDASQLPNHLEKMTIWNFNTTNVKYDDNWGNKFIWWDTINKWWKNMPPIIVGMHGTPIKFDESQMVRNENQGKIVEPQSLYEEQLRLRLGYVPGWLSELK